MHRQKKIFPSFKWNIFVEATVCNCYEIGRFIFSTCDTVFNFTCVGTKIVTVFKLQRQMCKNLQQLSNLYSISHESHMWQHLQVLMHFDCNKWFCAIPKFYNVFIPHRSFVILLEMMVVACSVEHDLNPHIMVRFRVLWQNLSTVNCIWDAVTAGCVKHQLTMILFNLDICKQMEPQ
jgi:hypothetical protein